MKTLFARITSDVTKEEFLTMLQKCSQYIKAIVSHEVGEEGSEHLHCFIQVETPEIKMKNIYQNFRNFIKQEFNGITDRQYAVSKTLEGTENRIAAYTIKEGSFVYYGFTDKEIETFKKLSYLKFNKKSFMNKLQNLEDELFIQKINFVQFFENYFDLRDSYKHKINRHQVLNYMQNMKRLTDKRANVLYKQNIWQELNGFYVN